MNLHIDENKLIDTSPNFQAYFSHPVGQFRFRFSDSYGAKLLQIALSSFNCWSCENCRNLRMQKKEKCAIENTVDAVYSNYLNFTIVKFNSKGVAIC